MSRKLMEQLDRNGPTGGRPYSPGGRTLSRKGTKRWQEIKHKGRAVASQARKAKDAARRRAYNSGKKGKKS